MDLKEIIQSLIQEGCIEETLSAIDAHLAAHSAQDAAVKSALLQIASDETNHAQLAWDTIQWIIESFPDTITFVEETFRAELDRPLMWKTNDDSTTTICKVADKENSFRKYGLLSEEDQKKVNIVGLRDIIAPIYQSGFKEISLLTKKIIELDVATF